MKITNVVVFVVLAVIVVITVVIIIIIIFTLEHFKILKQARNDIKSVMHCHSTAGVAVACYKQGLLPISQNSHIIYSTISYHDYEGIVITTEEQKRIVADLGPKNKVIVIHSLHSS
jgi:ribulose-5-phosphate 4-epimerase/fuculose-1-phosphate aldolase